MLLGKFGREAECVKRTWKVVTARAKVESTRRDGAIWSAAAVEHACKNMDAMITGTKIVTVPRVIKLGLAHRLITAAGQKNDSVLI